MINPSTKHHGKQDRGQQTAVRFAVVAAALVLVGVVGAADLAHAKPAPIQASDPVQASAPVRASDLDGATLEELVDQLGDADFHLRQAAEQQILLRGPEAFDLLKAAERHRDLEIKARAGYILGQLEVQWQRPGDALEVRQVLARYEDLSDFERLLRIDRLGQLSESKGLPALARIARFDDSPQVARNAALELLGQEHDQLTPVAKEVSQECGAGDRVPVQWVRLLLAEIQDPAKSVAQWKQAVQAEIQLAGELRQNDTDYNCVYALNSHQLDLCDRLKLVEPTVEALSQLIVITDYWEEIDDQDPLETALQHSIRWAMDRESWQVLDRLADRYERAVRRRRLLIYLLASAYEKQGKSELAQRTALRASELIADDDEKRTRIGVTMAYLGHIDWAEREWQYVIEGYAVLDPQSMVARNQLATWRFDRRRYHEAATLLGEVATALEENKRERKRLTEEYYRKGNEPLQAFLSRRHYYLACHFHSIGKYDLQREQLKKSIQLWDQDPDVLIAMYRSPGANERFREDTKKRIKRLAGQFREGIREDPESPAFYNGCAWLIANTTGDYQQALSDSKKSLDLSPQSPQYLDTLARCYYALGDYENAVKHQRQAIALAPHYQVMQRQLELFEETLETHNSAPRSQTPHNRSRPRSTKSKPPAQSDPPQSDPPQPAPAKNAPSKADAKQPREQARD